MFKHAVLAAVFAGAVSSTAFAWSEETLNLKDPASDEIAGEVRTGLMQGYFCASKSDAEVLAKYMRGTKVQAEDLAMSLGHCVSDSRHVAGIFPKGEFPVVFVRQLSTVESWYLVPGLFIDLKQQDARAQ